jgi:type I restriction enzyme, S subunit
VENGKVAIAKDLKNGIGCGTTELHVFRPRIRELNRYLLYYLLQESVREAARQNFQGTSGHLRVPVEFFDEIDFPLPPLNEQRRIVAKLEALLNKVGACQQRLARIPVILKRFRQGVLAAACSGRLTADWRENAFTISTIPPVSIGCPLETEVLPGWSWRLLTDIATLESGHTPRKTVPEYWVGGGVPWISLQDIRAANGKVINDTKLMPTILGIENSSARILPAGTVVFSRDISVGYVTIMGREMATTQHFANWICGQDLNNRYLMYAFMASRDSLISSGQGSTVGTIYMPALKEFHLLLPPLPEQHEIVHRVEALFDLAGQLEARYLRANAHVDRLTQSILAKAFRGELVPQDENDEPAAVLLERIRAQRSQAVQVTRRSAPQRLPRTPRTQRTTKPAVLPLVAETPHSYGRNIPQTILAHMQPGTEYSRANIADALGLSTSDWNWAIRQLKEEGKVVQTGERRGARYSKNLNI